MTSTPYILLTNRSSQASDRPNLSAAQQGRLALSYGSSDPGVYFQDTAGSIRKVGPNHYAATAPNSAPLGLAGNSVGETWVDSSTTKYYMKVWTGAAWQTVGSAYADVAVLASGAVIASGCILASGCVLASGAVVASGAIAASGSYSAVLSSGCIEASGVPVTTGLPISSPEGTVMYQAAAPSGLYIYVGGQWVQI